MGKRAKLTLPWHIKVNLNLKTGFYKGANTLNLFAVYLKQFLF